jgi:tRNA nucleotidyltransferase (CCA-adding enzyme)
VLAGLEALARRMGGSLYLVGGAVRDSVLGEKVAEFDLAVSLELRAWLANVVKEWHELYPGAPPVRKPVFFKKYLTGKILCDGDFSPGVSSFDFSQLRKEHYDFSGAYPVVVPGDIQSDLFRRDYSVNSMAFLLGDDGAVSLVDPFGGVADLEKGVLRVLHDKSFEDDPVRLLRGVRFISRFGFTLEVQTKRLFEAAVAGQYVQRVPRRRLFDEIRKALLEAEPGEVLQAVYEYDFLDELFPGVQEAHLREFREFCSSPSFQALLDAEKNLRFEHLLARLYRRAGVRSFADVLRSFELGRADLDRYLSRLEAVEV